MNRNELIGGLPGEVLVREGLSDVHTGRITVPACLVWVARLHLVRAGLLPAAAGSPVAEPEIQLYRRLRLEGGDAYSRYNSLLRELVSFEQALDRRMRGGRSKVKH